MATMKAKAAKTEKAKTKATQAVAKERTHTDDGIPLKKICAEIGVEPRLARRKLRNADEKFTESHGSRERWTFTPAVAAKVKAFLTASESNATH